MSITKEFSGSEIHPAIIQFQNQEHQIIEFHKLGLLGSVLSSIIHELNQPLTSMSMDADFLTLIASNPAKMSAEQIYDVGEGLQKDVQRSQKILDELRSFAQRGKKNGEVNINNIIKSCLTLTNERIRTHGVTCNINLSSNLPAVNLTINDLQFALLNLVLNSCNLLELFVTGENEFQEQIRQNYVPQITIETMLENDEVIVRATDNGLAITPALAESLQSPFTMMLVTSKQLLGGLYLTKVLVEKNNGVFKFEHKPSDNFGGSINFYEIKIKLNKP